MTDRLLTKEVLLDVSVNVVPLGIIVLFAALFLLVAPWETDTPLEGVIQFLPVLIGVGSLSALTYLGARKIES